MFTLTINVSKFQNNPDEINKFVEMAILSGFNDSRQFKLSGVQIYQTIGYSSITCKIQVPLKSDKNVFFDLIRDFRNKYQNNLHADCKIYDETDKRASTEFSLIL